MVYDEELGGLQLAELLDFAETGERIRGRRWVGGLIRCGFGGVHANRGVVALFLLAIAT